MKKSSSISKRIFLLAATLVLMSTTMANFGRFSSRLSSVHAFVSSNSRTNRRGFTKCFTLHMDSFKSRKRSRPFYDYQHNPSKHQQRYAFHINQDHQRTISRLYSSSTSTPNKSESDSSTLLSPRQKILDRFESDIASSKGDPNHSADLIQAQRNADWCDAGVCVSAQRDHVNPRHQFPRRPAA